LFRYAATLQGRTVRGRDQLPASERDYLKHVIGLREWPSGTTLQRYVDSLRSTILDPSGGIFRSSIESETLLTFVAPSGRWRGPHGGDWIIVGYGLHYGHWTTGFQPRDGLARYADDTQKGSGRWLHQPTRTS